MLTLLMHREARTGSRFYRVDVEDNLFGEYSVLREWGASGGTGRQAVEWRSNLRDAVQVADRWQRRAIRNGYRQTTRGAARP